MRLAPLDLVMLVLYLVVVLGMGLWVSRGNGTTERYFMGGRQFPGWALGISLVATSISSVTFIAYPADAFKNTWIRYLPNLMLPLAVLIAAFWILPRFRRAGATTAYEFLETRFGPSLRLYGAFAFIFAQLVRLSTILWLVALLVQQITGVDPWISILLSGAFVGLYTIAGGIEAIVWTDVFQTIAMMLGGVACLWVALDLIPGGLGTVLEMGLASGKLSIADVQDGVWQAPRWDLSLVGKTGTMLLLVGFINWMTEYTANQNTVQRYCAAASEHEARKSLVWCVCTSLPIWAFFMFLGTTLWVLFQHVDALVPNEILAGTRKAEQLIPWFINSYLPPGLVGIVLAAALAAAMSSQDSSINAISTVLVTDVYRRHLRRNAEDRHYLHVAWVLSAISTVLMILGALILERATTNTLQDVVFIMTSLLGGGLLSLYLLGFLTRRGDARAAWTGILFTLAFTAWTLSAQAQWMPEMLRLPFDLYYTGLIGNVVMFLVGYAAGWLWPRRRSGSPSALAAATDS